MKRIFYTLSLVLMTLPLLVAQVPKKILIEETTQASCPPCFTQNPPFDALMNQNLDKVVVMKYQVWWPGFDPMYEENTEDVDERIGNYLGANAAPNIYVNGGSPESMSAMTQARIDAMATQMSPISITVDHDINDATSAVDIEVTITNESGTDFPANTYRLITVLQEDEILYDQPPGTNGEREFLWVMRKMLPDANGTMLTEAIAAGESKTFSFSYNIPWYTKDLGYIGASAWVENPNTREVVQAEHSAHKPLNGTYPDLAFSYALEGYDGYCDTEANIAVDVRNEGTEEVTSFDISAVLPDGSLQLLNSWTGNLLPGQEQQVSIPGVQLNPGANALTATVGNIDGKPDKNGHNNEVDNTIYYILSPDPFATEIMEGFNISLNGELPANMILDNPANVRLFAVNQTISNVVTWPLGGHGNSDGCMRYDFPTWTPGSSAATVFEKVDLTDSENTSLSFTHAYAARGGANNDRILVQVSSDCAQNWETVYDVFGSQIITGNDPGGANRFYPRPNEWADVELDISQFDGSEEVIVRFIGVSGGAQAYYLDDINVMSNPSTSNQDETLQASITTFPNPASDFVNLSFTLENTQEVSVTVFDMTGKVVDIMATGEIMNSGVQNMIWRPEASGVYSIQIETEEGSATQKVSVFK